MTYNGPGKSYREGISTPEFFSRFPDDESAKQWFIAQRWPSGICCIRCGSTNVQTGAARKRAEFRCRDCEKQFGVKTGTFMQSSKIGYRNWLYAIYLTTTNLKGVASMKLHREIKVTQKTAWHMAHRIRNILAQEDKALFLGPVEVDETYFGGKRRNMSKAKRKQLTGRGPAGKTAVVGAKDHRSNRVSAKVVNDTTAETLQGFVHRNVKADALVYTDEAKAYTTLPNHGSVRHSLSEYVKGDIHVNGIESFLVDVETRPQRNVPQASPRNTLIVMCKSSQAVTTFVNRTPSFRWPPLEAAWRASGFAFGR